MDSTDVVPYLIKKAVSSKNLLNRADCNRRYATNDFNAWVIDMLSKLHFSSVLDICCGTGNQLVLYAAMPEVSRIFGIDISKDAITIAKDNLKNNNSKQVSLKAISMEEMFSDIEIKDVSFNLISCFYGLYYSKNVSKTLHEMIDHLSDSGRILIVGPYGDNNNTLFALLQKYFKLPDLVVKSSTIFMEQEVLPVLTKQCDITLETFVNQVRYPSANALMDYWAASTFYLPKYEAVIRRDIETHFSLHEEFIVEKHVMACIARRIR